MKSNKQKLFLELENAAKLSGFSKRHFRRIMEKENIKIILIKGKIFILGSEFKRWATTRNTSKKEGSMFNDLD